MRFAGRIVLTVVAVACFGPLPSAFQPDDYVTDNETYAVYAAVLTSVWQGSGGLHLIQAETERMESVELCLQIIEAEPGWEGAALAFRREHEKVRVLRALLPVSVLYRLIPKADIRADDARLALKYPGHWQQRPESIQYAAVSSVGFNEDKTKAVVYVRQRNSGNLHAREFVDGKWVIPRLSRGCGGWIA
jgi:hypothetical protein